MNRPDTKQYRTLADYGMKIEKTSGGYALRYDDGAYRTFDLRSDALDWAEYEIGQSMFSELAPDEITERNIGL